MTARRAEPFDAVELDLGGWWLPPATAPTTRRPTRRRSARASAAGFTAILRDVEGARRRLVA